MKRIKKSGLNKTKDKLTNKTQNLLPNKNYPYPNRQIKRVPPYTPNRNLYRFLFYL